ncbi:unnamed protein product [Diplocarpon coronariae]
MSRDENLAKGGGVAAWPSPRPSDMVCALRTSRREKEAQPAPTRQQSDGGCVAAREIRAASSRAGRSDRRERARAPKDELPPCPPVGPYPLRYRLYAEVQENIRLRAWHEMARDGEETWSEVQCERVSPSGIGGPTTISYSGHRPDAIGGIDYNMMCRMACRVPSHTRAGRPLQVPVPSECKHIPLALPPPHPPPFPDWLLRCAGKLPQGAFAAMICEEPMATALQASDNMALVRSPVPRKLHGICLDLQHNPFAWEGEKPTSTTASPSAASSMAGAGSPSRCAGSGLRSGYGEVRACEERHTTY